MKENIFENIKINKDKEQFNDIINTKDVRIERIVSNGQTSEQDFWYDQNENEFVVVLKGRAILQIKQNNEIKEYVLNEGDYLNIQANIKHRVKYTSLDEPTVWLAVFYK
ncbi:MAG: Uncharacterised protein [Arcobacter lacus]|nr:MAG: Uncharacterised protein [Arcobacter lacus]